MGHKWIFCKIKAEVKNEYKKEKILNIINVEMDNTNQCINKIITEIFIVADILHKRGYDMTDYFN